MKQRRIAVALWLVVLALVCLRGAAQQPAPATATDSLVATDRQILA